MAAVSGKYAWVTPRSMRIFTLDDNGRPYSTDSATAYEGSQAIAVKNLNLAIPDMRVYEHVGDDVLLQRDVLPSDSGVGADFTLGLSDYSLIATMTGVTQITSTGTEGKGMRYGTDGERDIPLRRSIWWLRRGWVLIGPAIVWVAAAVTMTIFSYTTRYPPPAGALRSASKYAVKSRMMKGMLPLMQW